MPRVHTLSIIDVQSFTLSQLPPELRRLPVAIDEPLGYGAAFMVDHLDYPGGFIKLLS